MASEPASPTILYAEDQILIQTMLVTALEEAGFSLLVADNGSQAIDLLNANLQAVHGVITDVDLGDGPDGWDVARTARELVASIPVVYVSAAAEQDWTSKGVPGSVMIAKPFVAAQVVVAISSLMIVSE